MPSVLMECYKFGYLHLQNNDKRCLSLPEYPVWFVWIKCPASGMFHEGMPYRPFKWYLMRLVDLRKGFFESRMNDKKWREKKTHWGKPVHLNDSKTLDETNASTRESVYREPHPHDENAFAKKEHVETEKYT